MSNRIYPVTATENTELPFVLYTVTSTESVWTLNGPTGTYTYAVDVDCFGIKFETINSIAAAIVAALDGWHTDDVKVCMLTGAGPVPLEAGYGYSITFTITASV